MNRNPPQRVIVGHSHHLKDYGILSVPDSYLEAIGARYIGFRPFLNPRRKLPR